MKNLNFLFAIFSTTFLFFACEEKTETFTGSGLQDSLASVRVYPPPPMREAAVAGTNLALQGTAYAQSTFNGYSPSKINDGSNYTHTGGNYSWANAYSYAPDGYLPQWVELRFDSPITFDFLKLYTSYNYEMRGWTMLALNSAGQWDTLGVVRNNISTMRYFSFSQPVTTNVVRILCEHGAYRQSGYARINELELY